MRQQQGQKQPEDGCYRTLVSEQSLNHDVVGSACWAARVTAVGDALRIVTWPWYRRAGVFRRPDAWMPRLPSGSAGSTENMRRREQFRLSLQASWAKSKNAGGSHWIALSKLASEMQHEGRGTCDGSELICVSRRWPNTILQKIVQCTQVPVWFLGSGRLGGATGD